MMDKIKEYLMLVMAQAGDNKKVVVVVMVVLAVILFASLAAAQPNQDHTCQGGHNCNDGGSGEQTQSQAQYQSSTIANQNEVVSTSDARAGSVSGSVSNSGGNDLSAVGGRATSSSGSTGGSVDSTIGINYDSKASSAAVVFAGHCQSGASGQISGGGFSVINSEQFCDYIRLAAVMREAYEYEMRDCRCEGVCTEQIATVEMICVESAEASRYLSAYHGNLWEAQELLQSTEVTGKIDRMTGQLLKVIGLVAILAM